MVDTDPAMVGHGRPSSTMVGHDLIHVRSWLAMAGSVVDHGRPWPVMAAVMVASMTCPTNVKHPPAGICSLVAGLLLLLLCRCLNLLVHADTAHQQCLTEVLEKAYSPRPRQTLSCYESLAASGGSYEYSPRMIR